MLQLEERANEDWKKALHWLATLGRPGSFAAGGSGWTPLPEYVAIGIVDQDVDGGEVTWWELPNTAESGTGAAEGRGEFYVEGQALQHVLEGMARERGWVQLGADVMRGVDAMLRSDYIVLWHTHVNTPEPSAEDIAEFPTWLADMGMVYHAPTQTTTLYNAAGVIHNKELSATSLATPQDGA